jgi:ribonuclease P protein component
MHPENQQLGKEYKLRHKQLINTLFQSGCIKKQPPFLIYYKVMPLPTESPIQVVFSAPKRKFKRAVDRNRIKRVLRELFRKNKLILEPPLTSEKLQLALFLIYNGSVDAKETELEKRFIHLMNQISHAIPRNNSSEN